MPLLLLGLILAVGLFAYYLVSTSESKFVAKKPDTVKKEENVFYLPKDAEELEKRKAWRKHSIDEAIKEKEKDNK